MAGLAFYQRVHLEQRIRRKRRIKSMRVQVRETSKLLGLFFSNLAGELEVVYISSTTYMNFVEIAPIVFELQ